MITVTDEEKDNYNPLPGYRFPYKPGGVQDTPDDSHWEQTTNTSHDGTQRPEYIKVPGEAPGVGAGASGLPGASVTPDMDTLYKNNAKATENLSNVYNNMGSTGGIGGIGDTDLGILNPLKGMFSTVVNLASGVGQKQLAMRELQNAQQAMYNQQGIDMQKSKNAALDKYWAGKNQASQTSADANAANAQTRAAEMDKKAEKTNNDKNKMAIMQMSIDPNTGKVDPATYEHNMRVFNGEQSAQQKPKGLIVGYAPNPNGPGRIVKYEDGSTAVVQ
ncbi:hypothetical protein [Candidatus Magnetominusculus xianensis]|uniref:DNA pilot protein n=1 Tax=Candidatus Magnetominusculus xianensis TaxID=1748249 RepID=A0ABR5SCJ5_9BACT|nr:hypothetical protein [Candidatus Magnetominusculus xianensis]KWT73769.1 hypothetical protein ASN18_3351 [Candidatus Magnetominusculus xianensis]MBF0404790.1 hypothetical protein [Nitrospirota bacterium]